MSLVYRQLGTWMTNGFVFQQCASLSFCLPLRGAGRKEKGGKVGEPGRQAFIPSIIAMASAVFCTVSSPLCAAYIVERKEAGGYLEK